MPQSIASVATPASSIADTTQGTSNIGDTELRPDVLMHRKIKELENSDVYKNADSRKKADIQKQFYQRFVIPVNEQTGQKTSLFDWTKNRFNLEAQTRKGEIVKGTPFSDKKTFEQPPIDAKIGLGILSGVESLITAPYNIAKKLGPGAAKEYEDAVKSGLTTKSEKELGLDRYLTFKAKGFFEKVEEDRNKIGTNYFSDSLADQALKTGSEFIGQYPAFAGSSKVIGMLDGIGIDAITNPELTSRLPYLQRIGAKMLHGAADGFLVGVGTGDDPTKSAAGFGIAEGVGGLFSPLTTYVGKLLGLGGQKLVSQTLDKTEQAIAKNAIEIKAAPITIALAGSPKQKINAATVRMLNEFVGGDWSKATKGEKNAAIKKLAKLAPELADQLGAVNKSLVKADSALSITKQRKEVSELNDVLTKLEAITKEDTPTSISNSVAAKATAKRMKAVSGQIKVGAAAKDSLEFEDNYSRTVDSHLNKLGLGKDKIVWEDRGHKLLFYLNLLMEDNHRFGPSNERNKMFDLLTRHLNQRYPDASLPDLVKMSDNVWTKVEDLTKSGKMKEGEPVRFFRQTTLRPNESPFAHEVKLVQEAKATEEVDNKLKFSEEKGDPSKAPGGKDRRSSIRISLDDPETLNEIVDMHNVKISMLNKELSAKGISNEARTEIKGAIERETRMKEEIRSKLQSIQDKKVTGRSVSSHAEALVEARKRLNKTTTDSEVLQLAQKIWKESSK